MAAGFFGSEGVESFMKDKVGSALMAECNISFVPHDDDIRKGAKQFYRYDVMVRHNDGDMVLHYKYQLDHNGRMIPDQVVDRVVFKTTQKGM
jgi:hypothetical protein